MRVSGSVALRRRPTRFLDPIRQTMGRRRHFTCVAKKGCGRRHRAPAGTRRRSGSFWPRTRHPGRPQLRSGVCPYYSGHPRRHPLRWTKSPSATIAKKQRILGHSRDNWCAAWVANSDMRSQRRHRLRFTSIGEVYLSVGSNTKGSEVMKRRGNYSMTGRINHHEMVAAVGLPKRVPMTRGCCLVRSNLHY